MYQISHRSLLVAVTFGLGIQARGETLSVDKTARRLEPFPFGDSIDFYDFETMNDHLLADPDLGVTTGVDEVNSCEAARSFVKRTIDEVEATTSESMPVTPPAALEEGHTTAASGIGRTSSPIMNADADNQSLGGVVEIGGCTGVLINERAILTAAHCVDDLSPSGAKNFWTTIDIDSYEPAETHRYNDTVRVNIHPDYVGSGDTEDDVAVVKLLSGSFPGYAAIWSSWGANTSNLDIRTLRRDPVQVTAHHLPLMSTPEAPVRHASLKELTTPSNRGPGPWRPLFSEPGVPRSLSSSRMSERIPQPHLRRGSPWPGLRRRETIQSGQSGHR